VRVVVIVTGLAIFLLTLVIGLTINVLWIAAPLAVAAAFAYVSASGSGLIYVSGISLAWICLAICFYYQSTTRPMLVIGFDELLKHTVFERICGRLGIARKRFPKEILGSKELFGEFLRVRN